MPFGSVLITLNQDNSKSFLRINYTISNGHVCVDFAPECLAISFVQSEYVCTERENRQTEGNSMKTKFYLNGKKTTRKAIQEQLGADRLARMLK